MRPATPTLCRLRPAHHADRFRALSGGPRRERVPGRRARGSSGVIRPGGAATMITASPSSTALPPDLAYGLEGDRRRSRSMAGDVTSARDRVAGAHRGQELQGLVEIDAARPGSLVPNTVEIRLAVSMPWAMRPSNGVPGANSSLRCTGIGVAGDAGEHQDVGIGDRLAEGGRHAFLEVFDDNTRAGPWQRSPGAAAAQLLLRCKMRQTGAWLSSPKRVNGRSIRILNRASHGRARTRSSPATPRRRRRWGHRGRTRRLTPDPGGRHRRARPRHAAAVAVPGRARGGAARLGELFAAFVQRQSATVSPEELEKQRTAPLRAPLIIVVVARVEPHHPKIPEVEQLAAVASATQNMLLAAHALGFLRNGRRAAKPMMPRSRPGWASVSATGSSASSISAAPRATFRRRHARVSTAWCRIGRRQPTADHVAAMVIRRHRLGRAGRWLHHRATGNPGGGLGPTAARLSGGGFHRRQFGFSAVPAAAADQRAAGGGRAPPDLDRAAGGLWWRAGHAGTPMVVSRAIRVCPSGHAHRGMRKSGGCPAILHLPVKADRNNSTLRHIKDPAGSA